MECAATGSTQMLSAPLGQLVHVLWAGAQLEAITTSLLKVVTDDLILVGWSEARRTDQEIGQFFVHACANLFGMRR